MIDEKNYRPYDRAGLINRYINDNGEKNRNIKTICAMCVAKPIVRIRP